MSQGLRSSDFRFEGTIVGTWAANALLKWIGEMNGTVPDTSISMNGINGATTGIESYKEFKQVDWRRDRFYYLHDLQIS